MEIYLDIAQANFDSLLIKDISNTAELEAAFTPSGLASVYAVAIGIKHSSEEYYRYKILKSAIEHFPVQIIDLNNSDFKKLDEGTTVSGAVIKNPTNELLLDTFLDGIYEIKIDYGIAGPTNNNDPLLAGKTYYALENSVLSFGSIANGGLIETSSSGTLVSGEVFTAKESGYGIFMLSANLQKSYANCLLRLKATTSEVNYQQITNLLNEFRVSFERTKILVINDSLSEAVKSFEDSQFILNHILSIV